MSTTVMELQQRLMRIRKEREEEMKRHKTAMAGISEVEQQISESLSAFKLGLDLELMDLAKTVVRAENYKDTPRRREAVQAAINEIANSAAPLANEYQGVKIYSGFGEQRSNHGYGCRPRHGSIVFKVEAVVRDREWTEAEREAAIYFLMNIGAVTKARAAA